MRKSQRAIELVLSAAFLVVFGVTLHSNWKLRQLLADANAALHAKGPGAVAFTPGDRLPAFDAKNAAGQTVRIGGTPRSGARESFLVVIDPACDSCKRVVAEVNSLRRDDVQVIAIQRPDSNEPLPKIRDGVPLFAVMRDSAPQFTRRIGAVPRVLRIAPSGEIREVCGTIADCADV